MQALRSLVSSATSRRLPQLRSLPTPTAPRSFSTTPTPRASRPRYRRNQQQQQQYAEPEAAVPHPEPAADATLTPPLPVLYVLGGYLALVNAAAAGLFWYDKNQALKKGWRVPERQLQLTALLGGWGGGMWAMETFRHKTTKKAFREPYFACVAANGVIMAGLAGLWVASPAARASVARASRALTGM
ncbi:hypothetical protein HDU96_000481 [Phlyctochytrium bullatum]|nr:hypothetical protein HDU96_000481 [Phlyctochytrium bullatum]